MLLLFNFIAMWLGAAVATIMIYYIDHYLELTGLLALLALAVPGIAGVAPAVGPSESMLAQGRGALSRMAGGRHAARAARMLG